MKRDSLLAPSIVNAVIRAIRRIHTHTFTTVDDHHRRRRGGHTKGGFLSLSHCIASKRDMYSYVGPNDRVKHAPCFFLLHEVRFGRLSRLMAPFRFSGLETNLLFYDEEQSNRCPWLHSFRIVNFPSPLSLVGKSMDACMQ